MILCTSIALDDDILDTVFTNEVDDDGIFIFNDLVLLLTLLLLPLLLLSRPPF
jgi:hypothetical protein